MSKYICSWCRRAGREQENQSTGQQDPLLPVQVEGSQGEPRVKGESGWAPPSKGPTAWPASKSCCCECGPQTNQASRTGRTWEGGTREQGRQAGAKREVEAWDGRQMRRTQVWMPRLLCSFSQVLSRILQIGIAVASTQSSCGSNMYVPPSAHLHGNLGPSVAVSKFCEAWVRPGGPKVKHFSLGAWGRVGGEVGQAVT